MADVTAPDPGAVPRALVEGAARAGDEVPELVPAATVVVLRDATGGPEVLMVRRSSKLAFAGGMWVFPGGRLDPEDHDGIDTSTPDGLIAAARRAASREALEEAAVAVDPERLLQLSHWTPPERPGRRFSTWFFVTSVDDAEVAVTVDGGEITEHRWVRPGDALRLRDEGEIELSPPTWITLWHLERHPSTAHALDHVARTEPEHFATRIAVVGDEVHALYAGDAGYDTTDPSAPGPRHRLRMRAGTWIYERDLPST